MGGEKTSGMEGRKFERLSLEETEHCESLFKRSRQYWPSASAEGISSGSAAAARPARLIIFHKIFHENDSITRGDVRAIMLSPTSSDVLRLAIRD